MASLRERGIKLQNPPWLEGWRHWDVGDLQSGGGLVSLWLWVALPTPARVCVEQCLGLILTGAHCTHALQAVANPNLGFNCRLLKVATKKPVMVLSDLWCPSSLTWVDSSDACDMERPACLKSTHLENILEVVEITLLPAVHLHIQARHAFFFSF